MMRKLVTFYIVVFLLVAAFAGGFFIGKRTLVPDTIPSAIKSVFPDEAKKRGLDFGLFWEVWDVLEKNSYVQDINKDELYWGAIKGMVAGLGDRYTYFLTPEETKQFADIHGTFQGIGIEMGMRRGVITVIAPLKNSPAEQAGVRAGDFILAIDDELTADMSIDEAVRKIRGPAGSEVKLLILHKDEEKPREIKIKREEIKIESVKWEWLSDKIALLTINNFNEDTETQFKKAAHELLRQNVQGIILDLRDNPGGYLEIAVRIGSYFVESEKIIVKEVYPKNQKTIEYKAKNSPILKDIPLVVLVNEGTASASEILAGALRDLRGTKLIGEKTFGKGIVQEYKEFPDGSSLAFAIAEWHTPNNHNINKEGLKPDFEVKIASEDEEKKIDPQINKALEVLQSLQ